MTSTKGFIKDSFEKVFMFKLNKNTMIYLSF